MQLETHLGVTLLNRTTRRVSPTDAGMAYYGRVRQALDEISDADAEASEKSRTLRGRIRLAAPMSYGIRHVAPRLVGFMERYPEVEIDLALNDRQVDLIDEGFDLAIRIGQLADSSLVGRRIASSRLIVCAAERYLAKHGRPTGPHDLTAHECLGYSYGTARNEWELHGEDGSVVRVPVRCRLSSNNGDAALNAAIGGLGIALAPDFIAQEALDAGDLVECLPGFSGRELGIHILYAPSAYMPMRVRSLIDHLAGELGERRAAAEK